MECKDNAQHRIIQASIQLFSQKGYDGTRVAEIAQAAGVTKALIYYYFKSKGEILDFLVQSFLDSITSIAMDFVNANIVRMIEEERLDIEPDKLHFTDAEALAAFMENYHGYFEQVLDFALEQRHTLRILMLESLKSSKHHNDLFKLLEMTREDEENLIFTTISQADSDFNYSDDMVVFHFFYSIIPLVSFAAYFDDYKAISGMGEKELRASFLRSFRITSASLISEQDILLQNNRE